MKSFHFFAAFPFLTLSALAGSAQFDSKTVPPGPKAKVEYNFKVASDYVFGSDFEDGLGDQDALHESFNLGIAVPLNESIYLAVGGFYERFDFGTSRAPVPTNLQKLGLDIGLQYRVDGKTGIEIQASPGIYSNEIDSDGFNVPILAYGLYRLGPNFVVAAGVRYDSWSQYEILPLLGFVWTINDRVKIDATLPDPQIEFAVCQDTILTVGGELVGGTFKTSRSERKFGGENVDYTDFRGTVGIRYTGCKPFDFRLKTGWSFQREFRYDDRDREYQTEGAPFVSFSAAAVF